MAIGKFAVLDYKLDEGKTDATGSFYLRGSKKELTNIDPKVNIYHKCNYNGVSFDFLHHYLREKSSGHVNLCASNRGDLEAVRFFSIIYKLSLRAI